MPSSTLKRRAANNNSHYNPLYHIYRYNKHYALLLVILILNNHTLSGLATPVDKTIRSSSNNSFLLSSGLVNLGNTCYLNAQLQCVYHIPYLRNNILHPEKYSADHLPRDDKQCDEPSPAARNNNSALIGLQKVFASMKQASTTRHPQKKITAQPPQQNTAAVSTQPLTTPLGINPYEQQDSQEFFKLLLPELSHPPLTDLYQGHYSSYIVALDGSNRERIRTETFLDLSLDVTHYRSAREALAEGMFTGAEVLSVEEGNGWRPPPGKGEEKVDALKGMTLKVEGLPSVLQLHLMRFEYDWETGGMGKVNCRFIFPKELDLSTVCNDTDENDASRLIYELQSVVIHVGGYDSGKCYTRIDDTRACYLSMYVCSNNVVPNTLDLSVRSSIIDKKGITIPTSDLTFDTIYGTVMMTIELRKSPSKRYGRTPLGVERGRSRRQSRNIKASLGYWGNYSSSLEVVLDRVLDGGVRVVVRTCCNM